MEWFVKAFIRASLVWFIAGIALRLAMAVHPAALMVVGFILGPHIGPKSAPITTAGGSFFAIGAFAFVHNLWRTFNAAEARHHLIKADPPSGRTLTALDE